MAHHDRKINNISHSIHLVTSYHTDFLFSRGLSHSFPGLFTFDVSFAGVALHTVSTQDLLFRLSCFSMNFLQLLSQICSKGLFIHLKQVVVGRGGLTESSRGRAIKVYKNQTHFDMRGYIVLQETSSKRLDWGWENKIVFALVCGTGWRWRGRGHRCSRPSLQETAFLRVWGVVTFIGFNHQAST